MDLLWPELGSKATSNNLRQVVHAARRTLAPTKGARYLGSDNESLVLCPGGNLWVDVDAFEEATVIARRSRDPAVYRAAIDLYAGDLLPDDRYEEWAEGRRESLHQLYFALLVELAGLYEERDEYVLAVEALRRATAKEPTFEGAHVSLMRLHALSGRPEQALAQYERLRDTLSRGLGTQPSATSRRLRDEIAAGRLAVTPPVRSRLQEEEVPGVGGHNLPASLTSFVGREREMVEAKRLLSMTQLLTLTGAGGSGKTRLALQVARDLVSMYPDGVWLVELAPLSEGDLVVQEVAGALRVPENPGQPLSDALLDALGDKELLLILDNCKHLVDATARLADALLSVCPKLRILVTSREPLGVEGEVLWRVPPLSLPATTDGGAGVESLMRYEAVRLFVDRARLRLPDFGLTQENAGAVGRVCPKLEGIPLAIELATARMGALAVEQVAQRLEASLDVLKSASRSAEVRQQTLRATLDWSYNLLSELERAMFGRLSVFAGGWTLEAAEAVCSGGGIEEDDVLDLLGGLVDKSLVVARTPAAGNVSAASATISVTVDLPSDNEAPAKPGLPDLDANSDTGISNTDNLTNDNTPIISGTAEAGSTVKIYSNGTLDGQVSAGAGGTWSYILFPELQNGTYSVKVTATDAAGNTSVESDALSLTIDTVAPAINSVSPWHAEIRVAPNTNVTVTFSEAMNSSTISEQTFRMTVVGSPVSAQVTYNANSRTATLDPAQALDAATSYEPKIISSRSTPVIDLAGNEMAEGTIWWRFVTESNVSAVTARPTTLDLDPDPFWCMRSEYLTVLNNSPSAVTLASVSITGSDAEYFSSGSQHHIATNGPLPVPAGNFVWDPVTFVPDDTPQGRQRTYNATLTYKAATGATIGNPVALTATANCLNFG